MRETGKKTRIYKERDRKRYMGRETERDREGSRKRHREIREKMQGETHEYTQGYRERDRKRQGDAGRESGR